MNKSLEVNLENIKHFLLIINKNKTIKIHNNIKKI